MKPTRLLCLCLLAAAFAVSGEARADHYGPRGGFFNGGLPYFGYGYSGSLYGLGRLFVPPYYAVHPPVYYSGVTPRTYGDSPFAWSGEPRHDARASQRVIVNNFYATPAPTLNGFAPMAMPASGEFEMRSADGVLVPGDAAGSAEAAPESSPERADGAESSSRDADPSADQPPITAPKKKKPATEPKPKKKAKKPPKKPAKEKDKEKEKAPEGVPTSIDGRLTFVKQTSRAIANPYYQAELISSP